MLNVITLCVTTVGTMISFAVILTQFIGAKIETLQILSLFQLGCLAIAMLFANLLFSGIRKNNKFSVNFMKKFFIDMPGWLMFFLLLLITTALLGDLSVILVRAIGHEVTSLFHLPSLCIVIYSIIYRIIYLNLAENKLI